MPDWTRKNKQESWAQNKIDNSTGAICEVQSKLLLRLSHSRTSYSIWWIDDSNKLMNTFSHYEFDDSKIFLEIPVKVERTKK